MINNKYIVCFNSNVYHFIGKLSKDTKKANPLCNTAAYGTDHSEPNLCEWKDGGPQGRIINNIPKEKRLCKLCARKAMAIKKRK